MDGGPAQGPPEEVPPMDADVGVVGLGSMGSLALWQLARRGASALGFEQFEPGHDRGAGHGESRIIRTSYREGAQYVPLVRAAFQQWRELERESGRELLTLTGAVMIGEPDGHYLRGVLDTARSLDLPHRLLTPEEARDRYPQHVLEPGEMMFVEEGGGLLRPERCVRTAFERALAGGARALTNARVGEVREAADHVEIRTDRGAYRVERALIAVGAWTSKLLAGLGLPLWVERQVMVWFRARRPQRFSPRRFPVFMRQYGDRSWYGFPSLDGSTVKVAIHHGGDGRPADPDRLDRDVHAADLDPLRALVGSRLPDLDPTPVRAQVCIYTNTADGHFVIGRAPGMERVILLGPMAGHGFKFAPAVGQAGAELALGGATSLPIDGFAPARLVPRGAGGVGG
jgi:sarcosine oxidase